MPPEIRQYWQHLSRLHQPHTKPVNIGLAVQNVSYGVVIVSAKIAVSNLDANLKGVDIMTSWHITTVNVRKLDALESDIIEHQKRGH